MKEDGVSSSLSGLLGGPAFSAEENWDAFLLHEGLDLLLAYRSIADAELRRSLSKLVVQIAAQQRGTFD